MNLDCWDQERVDATVGEDSSNHRETHIPGTEAKMAEYLLRY